MSSPKRARSNLSVSATPELLALIDAIVGRSAIDTSRSAVALSAIRIGLPILAEDMGMNLESVQKKVKR